MAKTIVRTIANLISLAGLVLLIRVCLSAVEGTLLKEVLPGVDHVGGGPVLALALALPIPLHVISIGLIVQRRWLSAGLAGIARIAIIGSGVWLGLALIVKAMLSA